MTRWDASDYAANSAVQLEGARELMAQLRLAGDEHILDVGCGDGKITAELAAAVPQGSVTGIDASEEMVAYARVKFPGRNFLVMDARAICFEPTFDVVFSHAALHWVDDHEIFLRRAAAVLRPGGRLVLACGGRGNAQGMVRSLHAVMRRKRWREYFRGMPRPYFFYPITDYQRWLEAANFQNRRVELIGHDVFYAGVSGLVDWLRTAWLPYTQRVPASNRDEFLRAVADHYAAHHPPNETGGVPVHLVRLEVTAVKKIPAK